MAEDATAPKPDARRGDRGEPDEALAAGAAPPTGASPDAPSTPPTDAQIHASLVAAVLDQRLVPGTKLVEDKLGQAFGVSRTRIRQVLIRLAQEQIVTLEPNRGASIAQPTVQEAHEVFEVRRLIEPTLLRHAVERGRDNGWRLLGSLIADEEAAQRANDRQRGLRLSGEFHLQIAVLSGHGTLERLLRELVSRTSLILMTYGGAGPRPAPPRGRAPLRWVEACNCRDHRGLLAALRRGDADGACALMEKHLRELEASLCFNLPEPRETDLVRLLRLGESAA